MNELFWFSGMLTIGGTSLLNVYHPRVDDGLFGRVLYILTAIVCAAGCIRLLQGSMSPALPGSLITLVALRQIRQAWLLYGGHKRV
ncbi:hypothetical protein [Salmonella phage vB_SalS_TU03]|nr:hypothetical protein [Salmonella phage vB_SalS_TU03]